jgi:Ser/Thr protein kinase RdoA (MazF antagonist)
MFVQRDFQMPRGGAHFKKEELQQVISHYELGEVYQTKSLMAGNSRAPKVVIIAENGKFLLKRRPKGKDNLYHAAFAHSVQKFLAKRNFPVTELVPTRRDNKTILQLDSHIYENFRFVSGGRYKGTRAQTIQAGENLGLLHKYLKDFAHDFDPLKGSFHDSSSVRKHLKTILSQKANQNNTRLRTNVNNLAKLYNDSSAKVNQLGFESWDMQIVHGDWHPGNMLFDGDKLVAVLDFDSVKFAPVATDIANGLLQFSIIAGRPKPADWPAYLDQAKIDWFLTGYFRKFPIPKPCQSALVDLMIETMIAEAILPIVATGFFGHLSGSEFLCMINRKANWLNKNRDKLHQLILRD